MLLRSHSFGGVGSARSHGILPLPVVPLVVWVNAFTLWKPEVAITAIIRIAIAVSVVGTSERRSDQGAGSQPDANAAPAPTAPAPTAPCVSWAGQRQRGCPNQCSSHSSGPYSFQHRDLLSPPKSLTMKTATY